MSPVPDAHASLAFDAPGLPPRHETVGHFAEIVDCRRPADLPAALDRLDTLLAAGADVVGFLAYEAAAGVDRAMRVRGEPLPTPLLWFGVDGRPVDLPEPGPHQLGEWTPALDETAYAAAFDRIRRHLVDGDTYQVNYTFPLTTAFEGDPGGLFAALRRAQRAAYCAWVHTPDWDVVSASPELFFSRAGDHLLTRPMKGTRRRGMTTAEDRAIARELAAAPKDRAENVMIVDLLRNDLGRLAVTGSVRPTALFTPEKYPTVWQLTSTVEADLPPGTLLSALLCGLYPCGSVTGAPKINTMGIIADLETAPRGVYCGAVGYARPGETAFNVAIRTLTIAGGRARYPVGSGLVIDSDCSAEYTECLDKARVLARAARPDFRLLETFLWEAGAGYALLDRHLDRLADSADYFGYACDHDAVRGRLLGEGAAWTGRQRVRLLLDAAGAVEIQATPLPPAAPNPTRTMRLAAHPVDTGDPFLYHKTTHRAVYENAMAAADGADDVLLYNQRGELTEATIANLAVQLAGDDTWYTPPVACGLLPGTLRAELLATGELSEQVIRVDELPRVRSFRLLNSVRGTMPAALL